MDVPSFDVFLSSIDVDNLAEKYAQQALPHLIHLSPQDPQALANALAIVYQDAVQNSLNCMKVLLAEYHNWLREQI